MLTKGVRSTNLSMVFDLFDRLENDHHQLFHFYLSCVVILLELCYKCNLILEKIMLLVKILFMEATLLSFRVQCCVAGTLIALKKLPPKLNPIIRPIMDGIKKEENYILQVKSFYLCIFQFSLKCS